MLDFEFNDDLFFGEPHANGRPFVTGSRNSTRANRLRVVLLVEPGTFSQAFRRQLESEFELDVVDEVSNPLDLLISVSKSNAHAVLTVLPESEQVPEADSHLLIELPHVLVIGICPDTDRGVLYRNPKQTKYLPEASIRDVLQALQMANVSARRPT